MARAPDQTPHGERVRKLTTLRPGSLEEQRDKNRDDMFSDPSPYFGLKSGFGLHRDGYDRYRDSLVDRNASVMTVDQQEAIAKRTRGIAGPHPNDDSVSFVAPAPAGRKRRGRRY